MKKLFRNLMLVAVAALGVASCDDVPPPFVEPGGGESGGEGGELPEGVYVDESFAADFGTFTEKTTEGTPWIIDYGCAKATGYDNASKETTPSKSYLVSRAIDLSASTESYITFQYILRYATNNGQAKPGVENKVLITDAYTGEPTTTTWTDITGTLTEGSDWNTWSTFSAAVPSQMIGKSAVVVAFYYACESNSATWEVKELKMGEGKVEDTPDTPGTPDTPIVPEEGNLLVNGNFEGWTKGLPTYWKSACTASNATLEQSSDVHGGSYAVVVKGDKTANKRLAYKEMDLAAGDYTMSFYVKAVGGEASVRPGYAVVEGGSLSGDSYKYADYVNGITNAEWQEVTHSFTLEASTTICVLVMNSKTTGTDVLIDDFKLTTTNGGTEGGGEEETPGEAKGDGSLENPFNAVAALEYTADLPADQATSEKFYVKGIVCESSKMDISIQYKNATFHISEDGTASTTQFLIFRTKGLNGADITSEDDVQVGDEVVVYASLVNYKGNTPETAQGGIIYAQKRNGVDLNPGEGGDNGEGEDGGNDGGDVPAGANIFENGDFEQWVDGAPLNWKSASSAGNVSVEQSTEAHGGSYAVSMVGVEKSNKRLAYKETTLAAGTYKFSFYAKGTVAGSKCQTRPGYVPMKADGTIDSSNYKYGSYVTLSATDWTLIEHEFTLDAETTICTVIMAPKASDHHDLQNILVDDASLVKIK